MTQRLGRYELGEEIGAGGMGRVLRAHDPELGRDVALKVLPDEVARDPERIERFRREARAVAALDHPNIVTIHSVEEVDGTHFLTMQLVEGSSLKEVMGRKPMPLERVLALGIPLCDAIASAHDRGVVHRDLKPANVMIADDGRPLVLDFGLAKLRSGATATGQEKTVAIGEDITRPGTVMGSTSYMAPEQAQGHEVDARADVFSLGVMLYEMTTGKRPFVGDSDISILSSILKDEPVRVSELREALPSELGRIVHAALRKDPDRRTQSARELRNQLIALRDEDGASEPVATKRRGWAMPSLIAAAVIGVAAFLVGRSTAPTGTSESNDAGTDRGITIERLTSSGRIPSASLSADGRLLVTIEILDDEDRLSVRQLATGSDVELLRARDTFLADAQFTVDQEFVVFVQYPRGQVRTDPGTAYRIPALGGTPRRIVEGVEGALRVTADGKALTFARARADSLPVAWKVPLSGGRGTRLLQVDRTGFGPYVQSPDGESIASPTWRTNGLTRLALYGADGEPRREFPDTWGALDDIAWSHDGRTLFVVGANEETDWYFHVYALDVATGDLRRITNDTSNYGGVSLSADDAALATVQSRWLADIWRMKGSDPTDVERLTTGGVHGRFGVAALPDGRIVHARRDFRLVVTDPDGNNPTFVTDEPGFRYPATSTVSDWIVATSWRSDDFVLEAIRPDGSEARALTKSLWRDGLARFVPGTEDVVYQHYDEDGPSIRRISIPSGASTVLVEGDFGFPDVSPDGTRIAYVRSTEGEEPRLVIRSFDDGEEAEVFAIPPSLVDLRINDTSLRWHPDGRSLTVSVSAEAISNLWRVDPRTGEATQLTFFDEDSVIHHEWTADGGLLLARGKNEGDAVLIRNFR